MNGHQLRVSIAEVLASVDADQGNHLTKYHRMRDDAIRKLRYPSLVWIDLDHAKLDTEIGAIDAQHVGSEDRDRVSSNDHRQRDGIEFESIFINWQDDVEEEELRKSKGLEE